MSHKLFGGPPYKQPSRYVDKDNKIPLAMYRFGLLRLAFKAFIDAVCAPFRAVAEAISKAVDTLRSDHDRHRDRDQS